MSYSNLQHNSLINPVRRKQIYLYLSNSFAYPEMDLIDEILTGEYSKVLDNFADEFGLTDVDAKPFHFTRFDMKREDLLETMQVEYTRLFINTAGSSLLVPPYESCYKDESGRVMNRDTIGHIVNLYNQAGLIFPDNAEELPDHIAVELEYMTYLIEMESNYNSNKQLDEVLKVIKRQRAFFEEHLISWVPDFIQSLGNHSNCSFYKELSRFTKSFFMEEMNYVLCGRG